jgi:hypothetical protein
MRGIGKRAVASGVLAKRAANPSGCYHQSRAELTREAYSRTRVFCLALLFTLWLSAVRAPAQSYSIDWFTIDGGGGSTFGGIYQVSGTIGQPDAGTMTSGSYILHGGFWGRLATLPPRLTISYAADSANICWPYPSSGYVLEQSDTLINPVWTAIPLPPPTQVDAITWCVTLQTGPAPKFYRLRKLVS